MDTNPRRLRRATTFRGAGWVAVAALISMALFATPGIALGHTPNVTLTCDQGLSISLTNYAHSTAHPSDNTVDIWIDGVHQTGYPTNFAGSFIKTIPVPPATAAHTAKVVVFAYDDPPVAGFPNGKSGFSPTYNLSLGACTTTTTTTESTTSSTTTVPTTTTESTTTSTTTVPTTTTESTTSTQSTITFVPCTLANNCTTNSTTTTTQATTTQATTTASSSSVEAATSSPKATGGVEAATSKPHVTPPPTDTLPTSGTPSSDTWRIALLGFAALLASLLILSPSATSPERRRR